jgi:hypothetical protein
MVGLAQKPKETFDVIPLLSKIVLEAFECVLGKEEADFQTVKYTLLTKYSEMGL